MIHLSIWEFTGKHTHSLTDTHTHRHTNTHRATTFDAFDLVLLFVKLRFYWKKINCTVWALFFLCVKMAIPIGLRVLKLIINYLSSWSSLVVAHETYTNNANRIFFSSFSLLLFCNRIYIRWNVRAAPKRNIWKGKKYWKHQLYDSWLRMSLECMDVRCRMIITTILDGIIVFTSRQKRAKHATKKNMTFSSMFSSCRFVLRSSAKRTKSLLAFRNTPTMFAARTRSLNSKSIWQLKNDAKNIR